MGRINSSVTFQRTGPAAAHKYEQVEKIIPCIWPGCGRLFSCKHNVDQHVREKHTLERPFVCDLCPVSDGLKRPNAFARPASLNRHKKSRHGVELPGKRKKNLRKGGQGPSALDWSIAAPKGDSVVSNEEEGKGHVGDSELAWHPSAQSTLNEFVRSPYLAGGPIRSPLVAAPPPASTFQHIGFDNLALARGTNLGFTLVAYPVVSPSTIRHPLTYDFDETSTPLLSQQHLQADQVQSCNAFATNGGICSISPPPEHDDDQPREEHHCLLAARTEIPAFDWHTDDFDALDHAMNAAAEDGGTALSDADRAADAATDEYLYELLQPINDLDGELEGWSTLMQGSEREAQRAKSGHVSGSGLPSGRGDSVAVYEEQSSTVESVACHLGH